MEGKSLVGEKMYARNRIERSTANSRVLESIREDGGELELGASKDSIYRLPLCSVTSEPGTMSEMYLAQDMKRLLLREPKSFSQN